MDESVATPGAVVDRGSVFDDAWHLFLGAECPGCARPGRTVCRSCRAAMAPEPVVLRPDPVPDGICVTGAREYDDVVRRVIIAWKDGRRHLDAVLGRLLACAVAATLTAVDPDRPVLIVPVPTTRRSRRERGVDLVGVAARTAARDLADTGWETRVRRALTLVREPADQAGLDAAGRRANLVGAMRASSPAGKRGSDPFVVVVDDVVTTGSTVGEATRALADGGWSVDAIAAIAAVP